MTNHSHINAKIGYFWRKKKTFGAENTPPRCRLNIKHVILYAGHLYQPFWTIKIRTGWQEGPGKVKIWPGNALKWTDTLFVPGSQQTIFNGDLRQALWGRSCSTSCHVVSTIISSKFPICCCCCCRCHQFCSISKEQHADQQEGHRPPVHFNCQLTKGQKEVQNSHLKNFVNAASQANGLRPYPRRRPVILPIANSNQLQSCRGLGWGRLFRPLSRLRLTFFCKMSFS